MPRHTLSDQQQTAGCHFTGCHFIGITGFIMTVAGVFLHIMAERHWKDLGCDSSPFHQCGLDDVTDYCPSDPDTAETVKDICKQESDAVILFMTGFVAWVSSMLWCLLSADSERAYRSHEQNTDNEGSDESGAAFEVATEGSETGSEPEPATEPETEEPTVNTSLFRGRTQPSYGGCNLGSAGPADTGERNPNLQTF